jgi:hypothetical protein
MPSVSLNKKESANQDRLKMAKEDADRAIRVNLCFKFKIKVLFIDLKRGFKRKILKAFLFLERF